MKKHVSLVLALALFLTTLFAPTTASAHADGYTIIAPCKYDAARSFSNGMAAVRLNDKWGFIDKNGKEIVPPKYSRVSDFQDGMARVVDASNLCGLIDKTGSEVVPPIFTSVGEFSENLAVVWMGGFWGFVDKAGNAFFSDEFSHPSDFSGGEAYALQGYGLQGNNTRIVKVDRSGNVIRTVDLDIEPHRIWGGGNNDFGWGTTSRLSFVHGVTSFIDYGGDGVAHGLVNETGAVVVPPQYASINYLGEGLFSIGNNHGEVGTVGMVDANGKVVVAPSYQRIHPFSDNLALVEIYEYEEMISYNGTDYPYIHRKYGFIDQNGKAIVPLEYDAAGSFENGLAAVGKRSGSSWRYGFIDTTGKVVIPMEYDYAASFRDGLGIVGTGHYSWIFLGFGSVQAIPSFRGSYSLIDAAGNVIDIGDYIIDSVAEGVATVRDRESDKWGFIYIPGVYTPPPEPSPVSIPATPAANVVNPTPSKVFVNGQEQSFEAYNIDGNNYFKLRDLAHVLNGTEKQFEVGYDNATRAVTMTTGQPYTAVGGEMAAGDGQAKAANPTPSEIYIDGEKLDFTVYNIGGNNFFKLRDLMGALDVAVTYDPATQNIGVDTSQGYTPE